MATTSNKPAKLFISYARKDERYVERLRLNLRRLRRQGLIEEWHDREIGPGENWGERIDENLKAAEIILLLVTPDFMASDYIYEKEMSLALQRHERGEACVIPIIVRPIDWEDDLGEIQALPKDAKPVTKWSPQDEAWLDVARGIRKAIEDLHCRPRDDEGETDEGVDSAGDSGQMAIGNYIAQADRGSTATVHIASYQYARPGPVDTDFLQAAKRQLSELPIDTVPRPAPLPRGSRMPLAFNPLFVGREEEFRTLAGFLNDDSARWQTPTVAVTGMSGVGKTQLASEFVHRYGQYFTGGVFWLNFANAAAILDEVVSCGSPSGMNLRPDFMFLPVEEQVRAVMSAWQNPLPRLLVFDQCEDEDLLNRWRPPTGGSRVLITSRRQQWHPALSVRNLSLSVLGSANSVALLRKHRPDLLEDDPDLKAIAEELGYLPLALELGGGYLARYRFVVTPRELLNQLRNPNLLEHPSLQQARGISPTDHDMRLARAFTLSYEQLNTSDPTDVLATTLLARAACFAPEEPLPQELLLSTLNLPEEDSETPLRSIDALDRLARVGLLQEQEVGVLRIHRLVAAFVRGAVSDDEAQEAVEAAVVGEVARLINEGDLVQLLKLVPHLQTITDAAKSRTDERAALLCNQLGTALQMTGKYDDARRYLERALAIREWVLGEEHSETAQSLDNLGSLLYEQGRYEEARSLYERALAIREKVLGEEHPETATTLNNLAYLLADQGGYDDARRYLERALAIREWVLGEEHSETAQSLDNLGSLLYEQGRYEEARSLYERALAIREKVLGEKHPTTIVTLSNLGLLLSEQGRYEEARAYYERALVISVEVHGNEHPLTETVRQDLRNLDSRQQS